MSIANSRRWLTEGAVIVFSILIAFTIDAWWETRQEREIERDAIAVLIQDLANAEAQLEEFDRIARGKASAAAEVVKILMAPVEPEDEEHVIRLLSTTRNRRTVSLPRSGYLELVSSGSLRLIRNAELRSRILQFYQEAERAEEIVEKNSTLGTDELLVDALVPTGLVVVLDNRDAPNEIIREVDTRIRANLGSDFVPPRNRLWRYGPGSDEWVSLQSVLLHAGYLETANSFVTEGVLEGARALRVDLESYLAELGG